MVSDTIKAWSFSRLEVYKNCPRQARYQIIDRIQEAPRPAPVKGKEHANERGSRLHENADAYIQGTEDRLHTEWKHFSDELEALRIMRSQHTTRVMPEELWLYDKEWGVLPDDTSKENIWLRIIADLQVWDHTRTQLHLIDFKSGKRQRNEVKHGKQLQLYQLAAFMRYPELQNIVASLWYIDLDLRIDQSFTRERGLKQFPIWNNQANYMCQDTEFPAKPSEYRCRFCPYQTGGNKWITGTGTCDRNP